MATARAGVVCRLMLVMLTLLVACERDETPVPHAQRRQVDQEVAERKLVVFAATSLREAFAAIGRDFERKHAGVRLRFNFAGTQELKTQIQHGAPADVFASA